MIHLVNGNPPNTKKSKSQWKTTKNIFFLFLRRKEDEVRILEDAIRLRTENQRKKGMELDATCQICLKTKFADGIGHKCIYCNIRCCARCGGKVNLRSNKVQMFSIFYYFFLHCKIIHYFFVFSITFFFLYFLLNNIFEWYNL